MPVRTSSTTVGSLDTSCDDDEDDDEDDDDDDDEDEDDDDDDDDEDDDDDDDDGDGDDNEFDLLYFCTNPTSSKGMPQNFESVWWKQHSLVHCTLNPPRWPPQRHEFLPACVPGATFSDISSPLSGTASVHEKCILFSRASRHLDLPGTSLQFATCCFGHRNLERR